MPHDRKGRELRVGDYVSMRLKITHLSEAEGTCNITGEAAFEFPGQPPYKQSFGHLNTKQVDLAISPEQEEIMDAEPGGLMACSPELYERMRRQYADTKG